jgi:hypothetical protein
MKISTAAVAILATLPTTSLIQAQQCLTGSFVFEFDGACTPETIVAAYTSQVYAAAGATPSTCTTDAQTDLEAKLTAAGYPDLEALCSAVYTNQEKLPFTAAAKRGTDYHFESMFFNGRTNWQEEVETNYDLDEGETRTNILKQDAEQVRVFFEGLAQGRRVDWPGVLNNFQSSVTDADGLATCTTNAAMCCWPKDRQANDNNGNCAKPYDINCVDKDPADNTNLCFVDIERGNQSTGYAEIDSTGFVGFPEDNNNGEGAIHCHGLAWSNDVNDHTARYKGNNLFFVSMYDHMYQRGYVKNIPGAPMCGCVEQMPTVSRSDCTQVDLTESIRITYDATTSTFTTAITDVHVDFNACRGINNRNNDLWAYMARLYYQGDITPDQFGEAGRIITNTNCHEATRFHLNELGMTRGYDHELAMYTKVAGREDFHDGHPFGKAAFDTAFWYHTLTKPQDATALPTGATSFPVGQTPIIMRICPDCTSTHQKIWYRRLTPLHDPNFDLLHNILYYRSSTPPTGNVWNVDFTLHSSYEDAEAGTNPWLCPNNQFNYNSPFTGECSPSGARVRNQYSVWNWFPGPKNDVAYYINKPEGEGIAELDLQSSLRFSTINSDVDLGEPNIPGRVFEGTDGALHISGGGHYIGGWSDEGHYFSEPRVGDLDVKVHVSSFTNIRHSWATAGIMLRTDNSPDSTNVFGFLSGSNGVQLNYRASKGGNTHRAGSRYVASPVQTSAWLRLVKKQDQIEFYRSEDDGKNWILQATASVRFPEDTYRVGLAVSSHHDSYVSEATFESYEMEEYLFPTSAPSLSSAPTMWDANVNVGGAREGRVDINEATGVESYLGYGTGIWDRSDSFFYHNTQKLLADGAFDVVTHTEEFHTGYQSAKGGIMIRDSNDADASHAFIGMSGYYNGVTFQSRATTGARTDHHKTISVPHHKAWIRLSKPADSGLITAYYKIELADEWIELGSTEVTYTGHAVQVGTAVTAGEASGNGYVWFKTTGYEIVDVGSDAGRKKLLRA